MAVVQNSTNPKRHRELRAFTLVELLVVIAIIALLVGILLSALAAVNTRAKSTRTEATMNEFSKACDLFFQEHGFYPGVFSEEEMATWPNRNPPLSGTENALLHLMGGYRTPDDPDYNSLPGDSFDLTHPVTGKTIRILARLEDGDLIADGLGEGPRINGRRYSPYYTPAGDELGLTRGQMFEGGILIPDLIDTWGQPIIYVRRARSIGPLVGVPADRPQFMVESMRPYTESTNLGELFASQVGAGNPGDQRYSLLAEGAPGISAATVRLNFATIISSQAFYDPGTLANQDARFGGTARGSYILISAGPDGIYFNRNENVNPGPASNPPSSFNPNENTIYAPAALREYNDIVITGGGQ